MTTNAAATNAVATEATARDAAAFRRHDTRQSGYRSAILVSALALFLGGCAFGGKADPTAYVEPDPPDLLYNQGLALLNAGEGKKARDKFKEVDDLHPYSEYARRSLILTVYLSFKRGNFDDAINAGRRYVALYPASEDAAYAQYMVGESHFRQIADVTRDQQAARRAIAVMNEVIQKYPESEYVEDARRKIQVARDQIAGKEMQIGRYYQERQEYLAAVNRFKYVVQKMQTTRHVEEALLRLTESYLALGIVAEAQTAAAVLGHNYPDSQWYADSYALLTKGGVQPQENKGSWISRAFLGGGAA